MFIGFFIITIIGCIHFDYGNDYMQYYYDYLSITNSDFSISYIWDKATFRDPGWSILCFIFKPLGGFFTMVASLTIIQNLILYSFIKNNVERNNWWIAVFILLFSSSFFLLGLSMLRQWFVMCIFIGIWPAINKKKWLLSLIVIYFCSLVHGSALILLPFAFWGFVHINRRIEFTLVLFFVFCFLWLSKDLLNSIFSQLISLESFSSYKESYDDDTSLQSVGIGYILTILPFFCSLYYLSKRNGENAKDMSRLVLLSSIAYLVIPFAQIFQMISRVSFYFSILNVAVIPIVYTTIPNKLIRNTLYLILIFMTLYDYCSFFNSSIYGDSYRVFKTIFSQL